jgi:hypothetical protein
MTFLFLSLSVLRLQDSGWGQRLIDVSALRLALIFEAFSSGVQQDTKLTTPLHLELRLRTDSTPYVFMAWCLIKKSYNFTMTYPFNCIDYKA